MTKLSSDSTVKISGSRGSAVSGTIFATTRMPNGSRRVSCTN
jgi:hypothetical protein